MEACLEALLEMVFCTKPPNFGVEARMEAPAGDALRSMFSTTPSVPKYMVLEGSNFVPKYKVL
jgi:hypothetical protein